MKIWAHTLVCNEERYLWFVVMSVINYIDKILLWDTGSSDNSVKIIKELKKRYPDKIDFREIGPVNADTYTKARQAMLDETKSDWFMILDGDEVWYDDSIFKVRNIIEKSGAYIESIVTKYYNVIGDIYHYQEEKAGRYSIDGKEGHITIRFMKRSIPGLYTSKPHGQHGYYDENNILVQDRDIKRRKFVEAPFMHFTHMIRSNSLAEDAKVPKRDFKFKFELGKDFPRDHFYPEVFFLKKPEFIDYYVRSLYQTPLKYIKRRMIKSPVGY